MTTNRVRLMGHFVEAVLVFLLCGCSYEWETVCSTANDDYEVVVRVQSTDATTPPVLEIRDRKVDAGSGTYSTIVKLVGWHDTAQCEFVQGNLLIATSFYGIDDYYKIYYLADLQSSPERRFEVWSRDKWQNGPLLWSDSSDGRKLNLSQLEKPSKEFHLSCGGDHLNFEVFILGARKVVARSFEPDTIRLDIEWSDSDKSDSLSLRFPEQDNGFIEIEPW